VIDAAAEQPGARPTRWPRGAQRKRTLALASAAALIGVGAFFLGSAFPLTAKSANGPTPVESPGFLPAPSWTEISTGTIPLSDGPVAIASNVPITSESDGGYVGVFPTQTLKHLTEDGIVFYAVIGARGELAGVDSGYPSRQLPLQLSDAEIQRGWEGQPNSNVPEYILTADVNGYNLAVYVFFGNQHPSATLIQRAQQELDRLQVPTA
jgi:hypothetical protein